MVGNSGTWRYAGEGCNPDARADFHRLAKKSEGRVGPIMVACEDVSALADATVSTDPDNSVIINPNALSYPNIVADLEEPRRLNVDAGLDNDATPDPSTEGA